MHLGPGSTIIKTMNTKDIKELIKKLVSFETSHDKPEEIRACLDFCKEYFQGLPVFIKDYESNGIPSVVISTQDSLEADVIILGHIDTAAGEGNIFSIREVDGNIYGRATLDMKAFVAASMMTLRDYIKKQKSDVSKNICLMIVSDEELGGANGAGYLVNEVGYRGSVVLVPDDGEDLATIVTETKRIIQLEFTAKGREAHGSRPWDGDNAVKKLINVYQSLEANFDLDQESGQHWVSTINLGSIVGGAAANEVPGVARMLVGVRLADDITREDFFSALEQALLDGVTYSVGIEGNPTCVDTDHRIFKLYEEILKNYVGAKDIYYKRTGGATDARYFINAGMLAIVNQSYGKDAQGPDEHVNLEELEKYMQVQKDFLEQL